MTAEAYDREIEITVSGDYKGVKFSFACAAKNDLQTVNARADLLSAAFVRQQSKLELMEKLHALEINAQLQSQWPGAYKDAMRVRAEDRARMVANEAAKHEASGRRGDYKMSASLRSTLDVFDKQTEEEKTKWEGRKASNEADRELILVEISRLRAIIAGRDPTDFMPEGSKGDAAAAA